MGTTLFMAPARSAALFKRKFSIRSASTSSKVKSAKARLSTSVQKTVRLSLAEHRLVVCVLGGFGTRRDSDSGQNAAQGRGYSGYNLFNSAYGITSVSPTVSFFGSRIFFLFASRICFQ